MGGKGVRCIRAAWEEGLVHFGGNFLSNPTASLFLQTKRTRKKASKNNKQVLRNSTHFWLKRPMQAPFVPIGHPTPQVVRSPKCTSGSGEPSRRLASHHGLTWSRWQKGQKFGGGRVRAAHQTYPPTPVWVLEPF